VERCAKQKNADLLVFEANQMIERAAKMGDLFEPVLKLKQKLPPIEALQKIFASREPVKAGAMAPSPSTRTGAERGQSSRKKTGGRVRRAG
jgi:bifunctional non-homologous end joining protein LigD